MVPDSEWNVRGAAAAALGKLRDVRSVEHLIRIAKEDESQSTRIYAVVSLGQVGGKAAQDALITLVRDRDTAIGHDAVEALENIGGKEVVEYLVTLLNSNLTHPRVIIQTLGNLGDTQAVEPIATFLEYYGSDEAGSFYTHISAARALYKFGDVRGFDVLIRRLEFLTEGGQYIKEYPKYPLREVFMPMIQTHESIVRFSCAQHAETHV